MSKGTWYVVDAGMGRTLQLICADSPEAAAARSGYGEVAVYVADYLGRFLVEQQPKVTRLSNANDPLRP